MKRWWYRQSCTDPCIYIHSELSKIVIVTVWANDLLLFADSEETMEEMKKDTVYAPNGRQLIWVN